MLEFQPHVQSPKNPWPFFSLRIDGHSHAQSDVAAQFFGENRKLSAKATLFGRSDWIASKRLKPKKIWLKYGSIQKGTIWTPSVGSWSIPNSDPHRGHWFFHRNNRNGDSWLPVFCGSTGSVSLKKLRWWMGSGAMVIQIG